MNENPTSNDAYMALTSDGSLLPATRFQPKTLLGAGGNQRETIGQLYATQIADAISRKAPEESRTLLLGLGLTKEISLLADRDIFFQMIDLILQCL